MTEMNRRTFITRIAASLAALAAAPLAWMGVRRKVGPSLREACSYRELEALYGISSDMEGCIGAITATRAEVSGNLYARTPEESGQFNEEYRLYQSLDGKNWERIQ